MSRAPLVIVVAAASEAAAVRRAVRVHRRGSCAAYEYTPAAGRERYRYWKGEAGGRSVVIIRSGLGPRRASMAAGIMHLGFRPEGMVALGFAGALRPDLRPGSLIVADGTKPEGADGPELLTVATDPALIRAAVQAGEAAGIPTVRGMLVTVPSLAATPEAKAALAASSGAAAVDMEAGAVAAVAARAGVPFLAAKIIFDGVDELLHPSLMDVVRADGSPRCLRAALLAARDPEVRAALHWAGRRSRAAAGTLTAFCRAFFALLGAPDPTP